MNLHHEESDTFALGAVVENVIDDPDEDLYRGDRGTILVRDALGDLHVAWDKGRIEVWRVSEARTRLRVIAEP
jgi:Domain of unknown function (DUF4314)